ncbi:MAG: DUF2779 domain-containing protein [Balneolaceae bacterium]
MVDSTRSQLHLNEYLVRQASSCPLKLWYHLHNRRPDESYNPFRTQTGILMRRAHSVLYPGGREAAQEHAEAIDQTRRWLNENEQVTIYGGVLAYRNFHARFPILIKQGDRLTLLQTHGKIWKSGPEALAMEKKMLQNRKIGEYVREAAYKRWVIENNYPEFKLSIRLCFPNRRFKSTSDNLFRNVVFMNESPKTDGEEIQNLFTEVPVDRAVDLVLNRNPELPVHPAFQQKSFKEQLEWMGHCSELNREEIPFQITGACNTCIFRKSGDGVESEEAGCWQENLDPSVRNPGQQVFDLIGHGNKQQAEKGYFFQEEIIPPNGIKSCEQVLNSEGKTITVDQRRSLQLLSAQQDGEIPRVWVKHKLLEEIRSIAYPLHFIDFEAATCAIPMTRDAKPYEPVLFQFSCHTMREDDRITHHQWLDQSHDRFPHEDFIRNFLSIPDIEKGTLVQYSPFEKQALNILLKDLKKNHNRDRQDSLEDGLKSVINGTDRLQKNRFVDLNKMVRDYFFNKELMEGLGLKNVLTSLLKTSSYLQDKYSKPVSIHDTHVILAPPDHTSIPDPYLKIQSESGNIRDGSTAMHAWLYTKSPDCNRDRRARIHRMLKRYCTLDSLALVMIFQYWRQLDDRPEPEQDLIVWD